MDDISTEELLVELLRRMREGDVLTLDQWDKHRPFTSEALTTIAANAAADEELPPHGRAPEPDEAERVAREWLTEEFGAHMTDRRHRLATLLRQAEARGLEEAARECEDMTPRPGETFSTALGAQHALLARRIRARKR